MTPLLAATDWHGVFFVFFALLACGFAVAVVATANVVRMAFYLTLCLGATAGLFFLAGAQFVGAMQFMIYVGGTLVLLIFGVMLTAQAHFISMKTAAGEWIVGGVLGAALLVLLVRAGLSVDDWRAPRTDANQIAAADIENTGALGMGLVGVRVDKLDRGEHRPPHPLPNSLSGYLFPFVIVSVHLLVVLVGASYIARTKRRGIGPATRSVAFTAPADRPVIRHSFFVRAGIVSGIVINVVLALLCLTFDQWTGRLGDPQGSPMAKAVHNLAQLTPDWLPFALGVLFGINVLLLYVAWLGQRWAVVALLVVPLVIFALVASTLGVPWALVLLAITLLPAVALLVLLLTGRNRAWARME